MASLSFDGHHSSSDCACPHPQGRIVWAVAAWLANVPVCVLYDSWASADDCPRLETAVVALDGAGGLLYALRVLSVSPSIRSVAIQKDICPASKVEVFHGGSSNGIDAQQHFNRKHLPARTRVHIRAASNIPEDALVLGFVGRIVRDKGIVELIEAWQTLREQFPSLHMLLVDLSS